MTKAELISVCAERTGMTQKDCGKVIEAMLDAITEALTGDDKVMLVGFGTFEVRSRAERRGINPRTKETMVISASKLPAFKAGKLLKEMVARGKH